MNGKILKKCENYIEELFKCNEPGKEIAKLNITK